MLTCSLEPNRDQTLHHGAVDPGEFVGVLSALRDPSFSFIDARTQTFSSPVAGRGLSAAPARLVVSI